MDWDGHITPILALAYMLPLFAIVLYLMLLMRALSWDAYAYNRPACACRCAPALPVQDLIEDTHTQDLIAILAAARPVCKKGLPVFAATLLPCLCKI